MCGASTRGWMRCDFFNSLYTGQWTSHRHTLYWCHFYERVIKDRLIRKLWSTIFAASRSPGKDHAVDGWKVFPGLFFEIEAEAFIGRDYMAHDRRTHVMRKEMMLLKSSSQPVDLRLQQLFWVVRWDRKLSPIWYFWHKICWKNGFRFFSSTPVLHWSPINLHDIAFSKHYYTKKRY